MRSVQFPLLFAILLFGGLSAQAQVPLPCVAISEEIVDCNPVDRPGEIDYSFTIRNISGRTLRAIQLAPSSGAFAISPSLLEFDALEPDASIALGPVRVIGASSDIAVRFCILAIGTDPEFCCVQGHHFVPGDCGPAIAPLLAANGFKTRPCDDPFTPDTCIQICEEYLSCDDRGCYYYSFTVTNRTKSVIDHIFIPDSNVTPDSLRFPDPLLPGEAARVWVEICDTAPGVYEFPIVLASCRDWSCCRILHRLKLPECPCMAIRNEMHSWTRNPDGSIHIDYAATVLNRAPWDAGSIMIAPLSPAGTRIETMRFPAGGIPSRSRTVSTGIDIPAGAAGPVKILIIMHSADFSECCLLERVIALDEPGDTPPPILIDKRPGGIALSFRAPEDERCCVQGSTDLTANDWVTLQAIDGVGQEVQLEVGANTNRPQRFFRLLIGDHPAP